MKREGTWWTYIVEAENGSWYTGISNDVDRRFEQHQTGKGGKYFKISPAKALVCREKIGEYREALRREAQVKSLTRKDKEKYAKKPAALARPGSDEKWLKVKPKVKKKRKIKK